MMDDNEREMNMERIPGGIGRANPIGTGYGAGYAGADYATGAHTYGTVGASKPKPSRVGRKTVAFIAVFALLACILSGVGGGFIAIKFIPDAGRAVSGDSYTINATSDIGTTEAVAKKVLNSVVGITSVYNQGRNIFGQSQESSGVGTGIIVHKDGYILTNSHVVMDGSSDKITVLLSDGTEVDAKLLWNDDTIDLAVIKVVADGLTPVELGDSDKIQIGAYVAAIGNP
ncbi:MAG: S1C family serine protease, partial [Clostridiales Family XIII bacterium]|nr:S1C family serine protease [Clostridiales Family XIII bacterium]